MDYFTPLCLLTIVAHLTCLVSCWSQEWSPNYESNVPEIKNTRQRLKSMFPGKDHFKLLLAEEDRIFIGAKNRVYNVRLSDLKTESILDWNANEITRNKCKLNSKTDCANYVRVIARKDDHLMICGTNAYSPVCRQYKVKKTGEFEKLREDSPGTAICPFDAESNATALYTDDKLFTATRANSDGANPLILKSSSDGRKIRTTDGDSTLLNEPNFVSSYAKDDKVFFFFREIAVENINSGKVVFSRVARVCKEDSGGYYETWKTLTSFFKARLNCSIPGEFPFYFDEIQSTSEFGKGNVKPTKDSGDRDDLIYAVFNTPENAIRGSAVCAFRYSDITSVFKGQFKAQASFDSFWLPVPWKDTPKEHPEKCTNDSGRIPHETTRFSKDHPLMDKAVMAAGGAPVLTFTSENARFTRIAIDWQVLAADKYHYDVMFLGTNDGRVVKAINKGHKTKMEPVIIEDIQVLEIGNAVIDLKVVSDRAHQARQKLVVVGKDSAVSIPLARCEVAESCGGCVALQDPYCTWNTKKGECIMGEKGVQNIETGKHWLCKDEPDDIVLKKIKQRKDKLLKDDKLVTDAKQSSSCICPMEENAEYTERWRRVDLAESPEDLLEQTC